MEDKSNTNRYSISDLATECVVTARAIRFYEDKGLLSPEREGQTRIYSNRDRGRLHLICRMKRLGFGLTDIKAILDLYDVGDEQFTQGRIFLLKVRERLDALASQRRDIDETMQELTTLAQMVEDQLAEKAADLDRPDEPGLIGYGVTPHHHTRNHKR